MNKLHGLVAALAVVLGVESTLLYLERGQSSALEAKIEAMKVSERAAWGKVYDMQESRDDQTFAEAAALHVKVYEAELALAKCQGQEKLPTTP